MGNCALQSALFYLYISLKKYGYLKARNILWCVSIPKHITDTDIHYKLDEYLVNSTKQKTCKYLILESSTSDLSCK